MINTTAKTTVKVAVGLFGIFACEAGGTVTRGTFQKITGSNGTITDATPANAEKIVGLAIESGVSGETVRVLVFPNAMPAS